jgi:two-component system, cell cycle response regulator
VSEIMPSNRAEILVVDDSPVNRLLLRRALEAQDYAVTMAQHGREALELLLAHGAAFDIVLLDLLMPQMDGYEALAQIKDNPALRHIPVVMISAVEELESVVRCLELGATDYLLKPFNAAILRARISGSLASKRLRDLELEYLQQVGRLTEAAAAVEAGGFEPDALDGVVARTDALGQLARVFQQMAREVRAREERLQRQVRELRIEVDEAKRAREVAEITGTEYFRNLQERARQLRSKP